MKDLMYVEHRNQLNNQSISPVLTECYKKKISEPLLKTQTAYVCLHSKRQRQTQVVINFHTINT